MQTEKKTNILGAQQIKRIRGVHDRKERTAQEIPLQKPGLGVKTTSELKVGNTPKTSGAPAA